MRINAGCIILGALFALAACNSAPGQSAASAIAHLDAGNIEGATAGDLAVFRGIPYAAPPVGNLRWRAPQPTAHWSGVRAALSVGWACPQPHISDEP